MIEDEHPPVFRIADKHLKMLGKSGGRHKYNHGHAVMVSGPPGQGGAIRLAARGALRMGAGLVSVLSSQESRDEHAARLDAIMVKTYGDGTDYAETLAALKPSAVCIGPNFGLCQISQRKLFETLAMPVPLCLDADAITLIAQEKERATAWSHPQVVMTPHEGELRRLIPAEYETTTSRLSLARIAAQEMNCCILFKGPDTVIAQPNGDCAVLNSGAYEHAAWLATAGSGDVLSGFITGLMARGFDAFEAAALGAELHLKCAEAIGPGLIAEDIPEALPRVFAQCLSAKGDLKNDSD